MFVRADQNPFDDARGRMTIISAVIVAASSSFAVRKVKIGGRTMGGVIGLFWCCHCCLSVDAMRDGDFEKIILFYI